MVASGRCASASCRWQVLVDAEESQQDAEHNHVLPPPDTRAAVVNSLLNVSSETEERVRCMVSSGMHVGENERRYLGKQHGIEFERDQHHNLVNKVKRQMGVIDSSDDFDGLLEWLQLEQCGRKAFARMRLGDDRRVEGMLYMSPDMLHHLTRNGQVLLMATVPLSTPTASTGHRVSSAVSTSTTKMSSSQSPFCIIRPLTLSSGY